MIDAYLAIPLDDDAPRHRGAANGRRRSTSSRPPTASSVSAILEHGRCTGRSSSCRSARSRTTPGVLSFGFLEPRSFDDDDRRYIARGRRGVRAGAPPRVAPRGGAAQPGAAPHAARLLRTARGTRRSRSRPPRRRHASRRHGSDGSRSPTRRDADGTSCAGPRSRTPTARCSRIWSELLELGVDGARRRSTKVMAETGVGATFGQLDDVFVPPNDVPDDDRGDRGAPRPARARLGHRRRR